MLTTELVGVLACERWIEKAVRASRGSIGERSEDLEDFTQDLYLQLLEDGRDWETREDLEYFILRTIANNLQSKTSRYYYKYKLHDKDRDKRDIGQIPAE